MNVLHAANRNQADRWRRLLKRHGFKASTRSVPIGEHVHIPDGSYTTGRFYADVYTDADRLPPK